MEGRPVSMGNAPRRSGCGWRSAAGHGIILLEKVDALKYLKGILLLYFLYRLNLAEATEVTVLLGMVYVLAEDMVVVCWGLFLSLYPSS